MKKPLCIHFASLNKNKLREIKSIFKKLFAKGGSASDRKVQNLTIKIAPAGFFVKENGKTFLENAYKKAKKLALTTKSLTFAEDSGIKVFSLDGKPDIKSARFFRSGKGMVEIIKKLKTKKNRRCCFTCAIVVVNPYGEIIFKTQKSWYGKVAHKPIGKNGFGYDPIFVIPSLKKTSAQISSSLKNKISHRAMAVSAFANWLKRNFNN